MSRVVPPSRWGGALSLSVGASLFSPGRGLRRWDTSSAGAREERKALTRRTRRATKRHGAVGDHRRRLHLKTSVVLRVLRVEMRTFRHSMAVACCHWRRRRFLTGHGVESPKKFPPTPMTPLKFLIRSFLSDPMPYRQPISSPSNRKPLSGVRRRTWPRRTPASEGAGVRLRSSWQPLNAPLALPSGP